MQLWFKGQSVFVEAEARRSSFYRSGDLAKYLQRLGCKIEEFQTSQGNVADPCLGSIPRIFIILEIEPKDSASTQKAIIVTADISKCVGGLPSPSQPSPVKNPSAAPIYESRAQVLDLYVYSGDTLIIQKQLRLAREKSNPPKPAVTPNPKRTTTRDKSQKLYHIDKFEKLGNWFSRTVNRKIESKSREIEFQINKM